MAWNDQGNGKDPWRRDDREPTDLDKIVQNWQKRLGGLFGGGKGRGGRGGGGGGFGLIFVLIVIGWLATGFYRVDEAERGIVQRFGKYIQTAEPGLHWRIPAPVDRVDLVNTIIVVDYPYRTEMLTADEQYVFIDMVVQYRRADAVKFSFEVEMPEQTLEDVTQSALREVVGTSKLEELVASGRRDEIASRTQTALQRTLDLYEAGIVVTSVSLKDVKYPQNVQNAVDDAQRARNDAERYELEADAYRRDILPRAEGDAARILQEAEAYRDQVIANAEGEAARFVALLTEYKKAPRVTRERLYIDAVEAVYGSASKVILDAEGSGNLLYLPIDRLIENRSGVDASSRQRSPDSSAAPAPSTEAPPSNDMRERRTR